MKIGYFADGPWAHRAFDILSKDKTLEIKFVVVRFDSPDLVLINKAEQNNIPVEIDKNINSDRFIEKIKMYNVDLFVSMSFNQIFKRQMINLPPLKTINCHAGKLPYYRGRNILNWVLINDEKEFGITVHYVDEGIDTGDIILQRTYPITDDDNYATLLNRAYTSCADILYEAIKLIQTGTLSVIKQNEIDPIGMYCGMRREGDEIIDWNLSSREIFNFVRAVCPPGPGALCWVNGIQMKINKVKLINGARRYINIPGQVIGKTMNGFYVKTKDTFVEVLEYEYDGKIRVGDRLTNLNKYNEETIQSMDTLRIDVSTRGGGQNRSIIKFRLAG